MWEEEPQSLSRMNQARYDAGRMPDRLAISQSTRLLVLTGAGVSAESGLSTFRDANGLWENHRVEDVATPEAFARDPRLVWRFYSARRAGAKACAPNAGHAALAELERRLGDQFLLVTQNVDDLHRRAGATRGLGLLCTGTSFLHEVHCVAAGSRSPNSANTRTTRPDLRHVPAACEQGTAAAPHRLVLRGLRSRGPLRTDPVVYGLCAARDPAVSRGGDVGGGLSRGWSGAAREAPGGRDLALQRELAGQRGGSITACAARARSCCQLLG